MKANPGGNLDPDKVYGRDELIAALWERLETQSVLMNAERRSGKTQILRKMLVEPKAGWKPVFRDLERIHSAQEFAELVYDDIQQFLGKGVRAKNFLQRLLEENETDYINLKSRTWKQLLITAVEDLMKAKTAEKLVFFWDEVPYMLESICRRDGLQIAAEVLDAIRSLRVEQSRFRLVFTGSIGLHHVLGKLSAGGIPTSATNDMYPVAVPPLTLFHARRLAADLLDGERIASWDRESAAELIALEVDCFPYYIQHVVAGLRIEQLAATEPNIVEFVNRQMVSSADPWQLAHFRTRLASYYPIGDDARNATIILDVLALTERASDAMLVNEVLDRSRSHGAIVNNRDDLVRLLRLMDADHYLSRDREGGYRFRFPLIRRWWKLDRGL